MTVGDRASSAIHTLTRFLEELAGILARADKDRDFDAADERLQRWKSRTVRFIAEHVDPNEGHILQGKRLTSYLIGDHLSNLIREADMYRGFVQALIEDLEQHPNETLSHSIEATAHSRGIIGSQTIPSGAVFIVHGRDELNLLRLEKLLRNRWHLESIILKFEPGKGRTLIEKFEEEAQRAGFAIVLLTPGDLIQTPDGNHTQARPNVVFELGWFYGRIGRERVCILCKRGTKIHTDLDGINRVGFDDSIEEAALRIETELRGIGLV